MMSTIDETDEPSLTFSELNQQDDDSLFYESRFLEDFQPVSLLGRGAFGRVFEARKLIDQKHYAVKRIKLPSNKEARAKVMREVTVLAELNHRNIVRYFHAWREFPPSGWQEVQDATQLAKLSSSHQQSNGHSSESEFSQTTTTTTKMSNTPKSPAPSFASIFGDLRPNRNSSSNSSSLAIELATPNSTLSRNYDKYLYIQMELCRKESLAQWLETRQPTQDIDQMYRQILEAVAHLHFKGLIHRDLKPSNIFFAMDGTIKVGDLGLVKDMVAEGNGWNGQGLQSVSLVPAAPQQQPPQSPCKNHTDQIGTRLYMSPEQVASKPYNHKVDVYALAVILFELLVKFNTGSERAHVIPELKLLRFPPTFKKDHGAPVEQLLTEMLAVNPDRRPEVKDILEHSWISPKAESTKIDKDSTKAKIKSPNKKESSSSSLAKRKYYKLLVIGDQNTGKTSIIHRYVHGSFRDKYEVTVGAGINFKEIAWNNTDHLTLEFFDIGGEERSRFMTSAFYRKAVGAFVVTDVTQPNGFQAATLWKKDLDMKLRMHDDTLLPCVLLINKCDGATADQKHSSNELDPSQVDRFCRHQKFSGWFDTSAKNDINIDEAVQFLVGKVLAGETSQEEEQNDQDPPKKLLDDNISLGESEKNNHKKQKSWC